MKIEIDQSGKIEYTSKPTVVAFSNEKNKSLFISAQNKRELQKLFRKHGKPQVFVYKLFASLIYILIKKDLKEIDYIIIDREYQGREAEIKNYLFQAIRKDRQNFAKENISFQQIGRKSKAHIIAFRVYKSQEKPDITVGADRMVKDHYFF